MGTPITRRAVLAPSLATILALVLPATARPVPLHDLGVGFRAVCAPVSPPLARCESLIATDADGSPLAAGPQGGYGPAELQSAYGLGTPAARQGGGQTVAVVDAYDDPTAEADLARYRAQFGLPLCSTANGCFRKVDQSGGTSYPPTNAAWRQEISLDLDVVSAVCPNCRILLVEAGTSSISDLGAAVDTAVRAGATQVSNSYGASEYSGETVDDSRYNHPGTAITAATGDNGYGTEFPASSPRVTAVGGTSLTRNLSSPRGWAETVWSGSGSGCSSYMPKPSWQSDGGCGAKTVADVAADADPDTGVAVYDSTASGGWLIMGGTSVGAPLVAGYDALVGPPAAAPDYPYRHPGAYFDVTSGTNGGCGSYLCAAQPGYDGPTGIGTPNGGAPSPRAPGAATGGADGIGARAATINGTVDPAGQPATFQFEYGTTQAYGSRSPEQTAGSDWSSHGVAVDLGGLAPETTYHYRIVASSAGGTTTGADATFTTAAVGAGRASGAGGGSSPFDVTLRIPRRRLGVALRRGIPVSVACSQACQFTVALVVGPGQALKLHVNNLTLAKAAGGSPPARPARATLRIPKAAAKRLRGRRSVRLKARLAAVAGDGTRRTLAKAVVLRR